MFFQQNIKFLRERKKRSQEIIASELGIKRSALSGYENGYTEPSYETLIKYSNYFKVSTDALLKVNLPKLSERILSEMERGFDVDASGNKLRVLTTTVNDKGKENIEFVPLKAKAGYLAGYADPEFIAELPRFSLPFIDRNKKHRAFQISGDSMPPIPDKSYVIGEYVQDWHSIKDGRPYILVTKDEGGIFKIVFNKVKTEKALLLTSTNTIYEPFKVDIREVLEVWKFVNYVSADFPTHA